MDSLVLGQNGGQIFVKRRFDLRLGGFQRFRLFRGEEQLAAPIVRIIPSDQVSFCLQIFGSAGDCGFISVQKLDQRCLCAAGIVTQGVDQINFRCTDALFP